MGTHSDGSTRAHDTPTQWAPCTVAFCATADAAMGIAFVTTLQPDESFTTMSLTINFFRPVWEARLKFDAHVVNRSKNTGYVECDITDPEGRLIAKAMSACTVLRGDQAKTR
jgi:uncharacterized protein (TIGR00369 family)